MKENALKIQTMWTNRAKYKCIPSLSKMDLMLFIGGNFHFWYGWKKCYVFYQKNLKYILYMMPFCSLLLFHEQTYDVIYWWNFPFLIWLKNVIFIILINFLSKNFKIYFIYNAILSIVTVLWTKLWCYLLVEVLILTWLKNIPVIIWLNFLSKINLYTRKKGDIL